MVILLLVLPVLLTFGATLGEHERRPVQGGGGLRRASLHRADHHRAGRHLFLRHPPRLTREKASKMATDSLLPIGTLMCIMGGGGALKQIIVDSGVGRYAGKLLMTASDFAAVRGLADRRWRCASRRARPRWRSSPPRVSRRRW